LIVRPRVWERFRRVGHLARALAARGLLQRHDGVINLIVDRLDDLSERLPNLRAGSRDFH
jgi:error-prone DNA polymerase